jgi:hypothetical protein
VLSNAPAQLATPHRSSFEKDCGSSRHAITRAVVPRRRGCSSRRIQSSETSPSCSGTWTIESAAHRRHGGLLRGLARNRTGEAANEPSFPAYESALTAASLVIVPALVLAKADYFLRDERAAMRKMIAEIFDPSTRYEYELALPSDIVRALEIDAKFHELSVGTRRRHCCCRRRTPEGLSRADDGSPRFQRNPRRPALHATARTSAVALHVRIPREARPLVRKCVERPHLRALAI